MFTPPDEGRDGAVIDSTVRPDHHHRIDQHLLPNMSPIRRKQQHRMMMVEDEDDEEAEDRMVLASPMGRMDLSTPAVAGGGTRVAEVDGVVVEATPTSMIRPMQLLAPRFHTSGEMEDEGEDEDEAYTHDHETYDVHRQEDSHDTESYDDHHYGHEIGTQGSNDTETVTMDVNAEEEEEREEERRRREEEMQSIELARQMMAEEAMAAHHIGANFLRDNADQYSQEDLAALEAAIAEEDPLTNGVEEEEEEGEGDLSYDHLLRLGEQIGDVKSERWAMVAQTHIDKLPTLQFEPSMAEGKEENHTEVKCQVCQCPYEADETLRRLPCGHCFHVDCVDQWLKTKDTCCFCKKSIVQEADGE